MGENGNTFAVTCTLAIVCLPFLAFLKNFLFPQQRNSLFSIVAVAGSLAFSGVLIAVRWNAPDLVLRIPWFTISAVNVTTGLLINNLSLIMLLLVSLIALPVHIYSVKYMEGDKRYPAYWTYLSFFTFAMLGLVVAPNLIQLYFFWELVGFASFLLIGFWYEREKAAIAAKKAFIMNRVGDVGFLIGIFLIYNQLKTFDISAITSTGALELLLSEPGVATAASLCFFTGAVAKSAQFPLFTWLPDAMEGPTAVSSLLHAATMVAAGVFLVARLLPVFPETALLVMAATGALTALLAAFIALTQNDLKRILAFSTISQLGFMILALGTGASGAAIFHLFSHAFFKCLLFLSAGVVIHYMGHYHDAEDSPQDIRRMGGLARKLPFTFLVCAFAAAALAGLPFTSGYLSKDAILIAAFEWAEAHGYWAYSIPLAALLTSWLTAFYIARLVFSVFLQRKDAQGKIEGEKGAFSFRPSHYEPALYWLPMLVLFIGSFFFIFSLNPFSYSGSWIAYATRDPSPETHSIYHWLVPVLVNGVAIPLIFYAWKRYTAARTRPQGTGILYRLSANQLYVDRLYTRLFVPAILGLARGVFVFDQRIVDGMVNGAAFFTRQISAFAGWFDRFVIDGLVNYAARISGLIGHYFRNFQSGRIQRYLTLMLALLLMVCLLTVFI
ncbi:MAG: NADH-quinone oxidoreductase subunit L [Mucilaginibacter polytrichastri]|nr:NADH-quinone oxidoreductase subunit L [Mucilaginibacter polytrichastri]